VTSRPSETNSITTARSASFTGGLDEQGEERVQECGYGREPADSFRPRDLKKVREAMIAKTWCRG
jgi:hypothetical protein